MIDRHHAMCWNQLFSLGTSTVASKYEELECLYAAVGKVIYEGLTNYEKATSNTNPTQLFGKIFICLVLILFFNLVFIFNFLLKRMFFFPFCPCETELIWVTVCS